MKNKKTYNEKLSDHRWKSKKGEILDRDKWTCQICGRFDCDLHVHHLEYKKGHEPWEYDNSKLITLCHECHFIEHNVNLTLTRDIRIGVSEINSGMLLSQAFNSLSGKAHVILTFALNQGSNNDLKTGFAIQYKPFISEPFNMAQSTITRVVDELLAKGFITVIEQGGSKKGHASIYGLSEKYLAWKPGDEPIETRRPFSARGFCSKKQGD